METFKQRLVAIRNEENELNDKLTDIQNEIRSLKQSNDELQGVIHGLQSNEKLLILKLESGNARLKEMESKIAVHELRHSNLEKGVKDLSVHEMEPESQEDSIELKLNQKREEIRLLGSQYEEIVIHQQHLHADVVKKEQKAKTLEKVVSDLETQYSALMKACDKAEGIEPQEEAIDDLETRLRDMQRQLEMATDAYETSEREITRLDRLISKSKTDLQKQQSLNESLRKDLDGVFSELA